MCDTLVLNSYADWSLPSQYKLKLMWSNLADSDKNGINTGIVNPNNIGGFSAVEYWSSAETTNSVYSLAIKFSDGGFEGPGKEALHYVRAIRSFYLF